eukprot:7823897-Karenia_brevis.AAC.1
MQDKVGAHFATAGHASQLNFDLLIDLATLVSIEVAGQYGLRELTSFLHDMSRTGPCTALDC